jgi:glyoxylase-like metal-dependent hydrolase (beta-lactamase superfamily II)
MLSTMRVVLLLLAALPVFASEVVSGVHLIRGGFVPGTQPDGNTVIFTAPLGLVIVDTGRHASHTGEIVRFAEAAKQPVKAIVNTHWHLDHIGGNAHLRRSYDGVKIYASNALAGAMTGFLANYKKQLEQMIGETNDDAAKKRFEAELAIINSGAQLAPDVTITKSGPQLLAGRELTLNLEQRAVTEGDLWIFDRETGVLVAGDLVTLPAPFLDTACPAQWLESLDRLAKVDFELLIPGHGAPMTKRQFESYRRAFSNLLKCAGGEAVVKESCISGWMTDTAALSHGGDDRFTRQLMDYYVDVIPARTKACAR